MDVKLRFFAVFFLILFESCSSESKPVSAKVVKSFFDLKGYFEGEVQRLHSFGKARKIVMADGKHEERIIDNVHFERELDAFSSSDINRPPWSDKYTVDSIFNEQMELVQLVIKADDEKLKTRKVTVDFERTIIAKVDIENNTSSSIATSSQRLIYQPAIGYSIESHQKVTMAGGDQVFKVEVQFLE